jgi:tripartite-type tricarboxylate transporter receptor subunit TctC
MASAGCGTPPHIAGELFKMMTGVNMLHVPYRGGGPALIGLLGGQVQVLFGSMPTSIEHIRTGRLRALAVTTVERSLALPDVPTVGEFVPGYEQSTFFGLSAPRATPSEIVECPNREINAILADLPRCQGTARRPRRYGACALLRRLRQAHRRRDREMAQGYPGGQHQAGLLIRVSPARVP